MEILTKKISINLSEDEINETYLYIDALRGMSSTEINKNARNDFPVGYETFKALREIVINNQKNK